MHRLDKDTSGLMVVAKNDEAHTELSRQIAAKECRRIYWAILEGILKEDSGRVEKPVGRSLKEQKAYGGARRRKERGYAFKVLKRFEKNTLVEFELKTGRTHQIRVHAAYMGHPVVGDKAYGYKNQRFKLNSQSIARKKLEFTHPHTGEKMSFKCKLQIL